MIKFFALQRMQGQKPMRGTLVPNQPSMNTPFRRAKLSTNSIHYTMPKAIAEQWMQATACENALAFGQPSMIATQSLYYNYVQALSPPCRADALF